MNGTSTWDACALPWRDTMGRPTKSEPRNQQLNLSLTASEFARICARAEAVGMRPVHFGRALVLDENRKPPGQASAERHTSQLIYIQLVRLGNNLNQLMRHLHRHGGPVPADLEPLLRDIRHLIIRNMPR
jgi:hypothetical protein